jgi:inorganic pyrophosphatase
MELDAIVEVPMGSRNKYEMDHEVGRIRLDRTLFTAMAYPTDYGYLPETLARDGDPLDVLVLVTQATFPGCEVTVRPVALFQMADEHGSDAKVLCVPARDPRQDGVRDLGDVSEYLLSEISHFFDVYKMLEPGKSSQVGGWHARAEAEDVIVEAQRRRRAAAPE